MTIEFTLPENAPSIHDNARFRGLSHAARLRVIAQWTAHWMRHV